jgi:hypothetical protein
VPCLARVLTGNGGVGGEQRKKTHLGEKEAKTGGESPPGDRLELRDKEGVRGNWV